MFRKDRIEDFSSADDMVSGDLDIRCLSFHTSKWLMDHDLSMRKSIALSLRTATEDDRSHRCSESYCDRDDIWLDRLHRIVDRETSSDMPSWRVHIESDRRFRIDFLEVEKLSDDRISYCRVDSITEKYHPIFEKARIDIVGALLSSDFIDNRRYEEIRNRGLDFLSFEFFRHRRKIRR